MESTSAAASPRTFWDYWQLFLAVWDVMVGMRTALPQVNPKQKNPACEQLLLKDGETVWVTAHAVLAEEQVSVHYEGTSQGLSFGVGMGVRGSVRQYQGQPVLERRIKLVDQGTLTVTDQRVIFEGANKTITFRRAQLVGTQRGTDFLRFRRENEKQPSYFVIQDNHALEKLWSTLNCKDVGGRTWHAA